MLAIDLLDTPEHIFERLVFSNEEDEVYEDNEAAKFTYQRAGFVPVGITYDCTGKKTIRMKLEQ